MNLQSPNLRNLLLAGFILTFTAACGSNSSDDSVNVVDDTSMDMPTDPPVAEQPFQELYNQGVDRYLGVFAPMSANQSSDGITTYTFDGSADGPVCFTGNPFAMSTRDGTRSELIIFLQGGGACTPNACDAVEAAEPATPIPFGILSATDPTNPAADYNTAYLPYCDGSLWMGDRDSDEDGDGTSDRLFRGLQNLSASLDVIVGAYPSPSKILLTGNSAGGAGTHAAIPLVRKLYPEVPIELVNDSGMGILPEGGQDNLNLYWNSDAFFPDSCENCIGDDGNLTDYHKYQLAEDPDLRVGFLSTKQDAVVTVERGTLSGAEFEEQLLVAIGELSDAFPERFQSMIADGDGHTFILRDFERAVGGVTVKQWITDMLDDDADWVSVSD
ncbi:MAG: pectin acetylesterase-family hydrolase [Pseudomonadota bacterium]